MWTFIDNNQVILVDHFKRLVADCDELMIATAFVRESGVRLIHRELSALVQRGGRLRILFGTDFAFTEGSAIRLLIKLGAQVKAYKSKEVFHPKGYIFRKRKSYAMIIGSANLSGSGLTAGREWCLLIQTDESHIAGATKEFERLWNSENSRSVSESLFKQLDRKDSINITRQIRKEDVVKPLLRVPSERDILHNPSNYVVCNKPKKPDAPNWWFNIYQGKFNKKAKNGDFFVVVVCDGDKPTERIYRIPSNFLQKKILPKAYLEPDKRWMFYLLKSGDEFVWSHDIHVNGKPFLFSKKREV